MSVNVTATIRNGKLILECDLAQRFGASSTGKSLIIASSEGFKWLDGHGQPGDVCYRLNVVAVPLNKRRKAAPEAA